MNKPILLPVLSALGLCAAGAAMAAPYYWVDNAGRPVTDGSGHCIHALYHGATSASCGGAAPTPAPAAKPAPAPVVAVVIDTDGDGVPDDRDNCPGTAAGSKVDSRGCTIVADSDGDGVTDDKDLCADTPRGAPVNATGCSEKLVVQDLRFANNSAELAAESKTQLSGIVAKIKNNPAIAGITISGHTDDRGAASYNQQLSEQRAQAVRQYFIEQGVAGAIIRATGQGESQPIADNASADGRAQNRRVEIDFQME